LITVAAVAGLALLGTGGAFAYRTFFNGGAPTVPPLIKAESGPNKVVPVSQTNDAGANKQIYDRVGSGGQAEKIVSREEQPMDVKPANTRPAYVPANNGGANTVPPVNGQAPTAWPNPPGATVMPPAPGNQTEPRKVRTVTIRPDGQGAASPPPATVPSRGGATDLAPPSPPPAARAQQVPARASGNAPLSLTPQGAERTASADPRAAVRAPATTASSGGGYVVQLSAQKTEEDASAAFRSVQSRHPGLLGSRQLLLRRKDIPGKGTFYGAQVGPFASREDAIQLCESLKSAGSTCLVQKN
jgi:hypothetical protein